MGNRSRAWRAVDDGWSRMTLVPPTLMSGPQITSNGGPRMTSVPWILLVAFIHLHASQAISRCEDNGCAEQFEGLGGCVNLAAPLQLSELSTRFDLAATSLKGLCGAAVGCCHCMKLLATNPTEPNSTSKKPKKPKRSKKPKRPKKPKRSKKPKTKKPKSKTSKNPKPKQYILTHMYTKNDSYTS